MTIQLNAEQEQVVGQAIEAGLIANADDIVDLGVDAIRQRLQLRVETKSGLSTEQWLQEFRSWVHGHATTTPLLSDEAISRETIYGVRGM